MKITKQALKRIIKEEITSVLNEAEDYGPSELERLFSSLFKQRRTDAHPNGLDAARAAQILKTEHPDIEEGGVKDLAAQAGAMGNREQETWGYAVAKELGAEPETWRDDLPEEVRDINIVETSSELIPQEHEDDITWTTYDIMLSGKRVGELEYGDYFGNTDGHLFNRRIDVSRYENKDMIRPAPYGKLVSFLKTETGKKFLASRTVRRFFAAGEEASR